MWGDMAPSPHLPTDMHGYSSHTNEGKFSMFYFSTKKIFLINFKNIFQRSDREKDFLSIDILFILKYCFLDF
jgi:hypothetical protein